MNSNPDGFSRASWRGAVRTSMVSIWTARTRVASAVVLGLIVAFAVNPSSARADIVWTVDATFQGGTSLTGTFSINVYGYLSAANLTTQSNGAFTGFTYTLSDSNVATGVVAPFYIDLQPAYHQDLHLQFAGSLLAPSADNVVVSGSIGPGPSYECQGSYGCYLPSGGETRYIGSGFASAVPEPATWVLMLVGLLGIGAFGRGRRHSATFRGLDVAAIC